MKCPLVLKNCSVLVAGGKASAERGELRLETCCFCLPADYARRTRKEFADLNECRKHCVQQQAGLARLRVWE